MLEGSLTRLLSVGAIGPLGPEISSSPLEGVIGLRFVRGLADNEDRKLLVKKRGLYHTGLQRYILNRKNKVGGTYVGPLYDTVVSSAVLSDR